MYNDEHQVVYGSDGRVDGDDVRFVLFSLGMNVWCLHAPSAISAIREMRSEHFHELKKKKEEDLVANLLHNVRVYTYAFQIA